MLKILDFKSEKELENNSSKNELIEFLFKHLDQFGDDKKSIGNCIDYAFSIEAGKGGFVLVAYKDNEIVGVLIMNNTGMKGYIPENVLVYIAVDSKFRGQGIGQQIMERAFELTKGDIKLHVEYDNPAKRLYERLGFINKYAEMRYSN